MKRKFSFNIPPLVSLCIPEGDRRTPGIQVRVLTHLQKIGPSKADNKALKDALAAQSAQNALLDSPTETPKSVRPPLDPRTDAELRAACAYILQGFKPSSQVYEEQYGNGAAKPQLDYATIKQSVHKEMEEEAPPLTKLNTHVPPEDNDTASELDRLSPSAFAYKPESDIKDLFKKEEESRQAIAQRIMMRHPEVVLSSEKPKAPPATARNASHVRSQSHPEQAAVLNVPKDSDERPRTAPRVDSVDTTGSTPQTDSTEYPWTTSTAPTTAAMTPAHSSKRTSQQRIQAEQESTSIPKADASAAEWMKQELDKRKKAQDAALAAASPSPPREPAPTRKPVPVRSRADSRTEVPDTRTPNRTEVPNSRAPSRAEILSSRAPSRLDGGDTSRAPSRNEMPSRPQSRGRSISNNIKEYIRPASANRSRQMSGDETRPGSRSASFDSFRSAVSEYMPSRTPSTKGWRSWKPFHNRTASTESPDVSRPTTAGSARGRSETRETRDSPPKSKPTINLNRELPPLPGLDQWKDAEPEKPKHIAALASPISSKSHHSRKETVASEPIVDEKDEIVAARMGSPVPPKNAGGSSEARNLNRRSPPGPVEKALLATAAAQATAAHGALASTGRDLDLHDQFLPPIGKEVKQQRRRSKSIQIPTYPPELTANLRDAPASQVNMDTLPIIASRRAELVNYSRVAGGPITGGLSRKVSTSGHVAGTAAHSRKNSDATNFSRKVLVDDYGRLYDPRYPNVVEIPNSSANRPPLPRKDSKPRWKWFGGSKEKRQQSWMDQIERAGASSGMLLTDEVASAPIVRY